MLRYSQLNDVWEDKNLYDRQQGKPHSFATTNTSNNLPVVSRAFSEPKIDSWLNDHSADKNLIHTLLQELKEREWMHFLQLQQRNGCCQCSGGCCKSKQEGPSLPMQVLWLIPLFLLIAAFIVYVISMMQRMNSSLQSLQRMVWSIPLTNGYASPLGSYNPFPHR